MQKSKREISEQCDVINEYYAKDISKKIKSTFKAKGESGKHVASSPPYGYLKDSGDKNQWIIDEVAAPIVRRIFRMTLERYKDSLSKYPELKERMQNLLQNGEKVTLKQWKAEIQSLQAEYNSIGKEQTKTTTELAYAKVISYNRKNLERELQNERRQHSRQQSKTKQREEDI